MQDALGNVKVGITNGVDYRTRSVHNQIPHERRPVRLETLTKYVGADAAEYMAGYGAMAIEDQAARCRHEADLRERTR